jgi:Ca-activated chloride channel family protein
VKKQKTLIFLFWISSLFARASQLSDLLIFDPTPSQWYQYQKIIQSLKKENWASADREIHTMLEENPRDWRLFHSLGVVFRGQEQWDKSIQALLTAENLAKFPEDFFAIYFNLGEVFGKKQEIDTATHYYQKALDIYPQSREVKVNIELLLKQQSQSGKGKGEQNKDQKNNQGNDQKNKDSQSDKDKEDKDKQPKSYQPNQPSQGKNFKSEDLSEADAKKILDEIGRQEKKIRAEFFRKQRKEKPRDKDW